MKTYHDKDTTPLAFHTFYRWVCLPLGFLSTLGNLAQLRTLYPTAANFDKFVCLVDLVLIVVCFVDFTRQRPLAWYAVITRLWLLVGYSTIILLVCMINAPQAIGTALGQLIAVSIYGILCGVYYLKRKPLFVPDVAQSSETSGAPHLPAEDTTTHQTATPPIAFCRKCGNELLPGSNSCSSCGTLVAKE